MNTKGKELKRIARQNLLGHYRVPVAVTLLPSIFISLAQSVFSLAIGEVVTVQQLIITYAVDFLLLLITQVFSAGTILVHLNLARKKEANVGMLFYGFKNHPDRYILAGLLTLLLLVVPMLPFFGSIYYFYYINDSFNGLLVMLGGLLVTLILAFYVEANIFLMFYFLVDHSEMKVTTALKLSVSHMKGHRFRLVGIYISYIPMLILAILSLGVGILWVSPYFNQTISMFYLNVIGERPTCSAKFF